MCLAYTAVSAFRAFSHSLLSRDLPSGYYCCLNFIDEETGVQRLSDLPQATQLIEVSLVAQTVMNLSAMQKTWVQTLGCEGPLEKEMATHSSILAWRSPWTEEVSGLQSKGSQGVGHD